VASQALLKVVAHLSESAQRGRFVISATTNPVRKLNPSNQGLNRLGIVVAPSVGGIARP
jgi:hypothetical protein